MLRSQADVPKRTSLAAGRWWRFSRYALKDGLIRPHPEATFEEYDPWVENAITPSGWAFSAGPVEPGTIKKERLGEPGRTYLTLVDLLSRTGDFYEDYPRRSALRWQRRRGPEVEEAVLDWCAHHGLLGLLLDDVCQIRLAPRYHLGFQCAIVRQKLYTRSESGWNTIYLDERVSALALHGINEGDLVPSDVVRQHPGDFGPLNSGVIEKVRQLHPLDTLVMSRPLGPAMARYFPDVPGHLRRTYEYPVPLSGQFWREYAESVDQILYAAQRIWDAFQCLGLLTVDEEARDHLWNPLDWRSVQAVLRELVGPVHPKISFRINEAGKALTPSRAEGGDDVEAPAALPGGMAADLSWETNSLFSAFVLMAVQDYTSGFLQQCENCGAWMRVEKPSTRNCSEECRHSAKIRRYRAKRRNEKRDAAGDQGQQSIPDDPNAK